MRITWRLLLGFLAVSVLALLAALASPSWPRERGADDGSDGGSDAGARAGAPATVRGAAPCTLHATTPREAARRARPGDTVCFDGDLSRRRLVITRGGSREHPIIYAGGGDAVDGITIEADDVIVEGFRSVRPEAPGIELTGHRVTVRNNTVIGPRGGDGDGIRFFGDDLTIAHNTVRGTDNSHGRHADCMQTFAGDTPPSHRVRIEDNRCEQVDNMCLMAEGPNDGEGDGRGTTSDFTIRGNHCETLRASQALMFEDVQNATITGNVFAAPTDHAIGLAYHSTGARVDGNTRHSGIRYEVGIDDSSRAGYRGPEPGGLP
ncbi:right-handed parallel beta-helix repeat-containing protein [Streptomyces sp. 4503]|uniref:Right-handed parallel beta-helix repeat-containing protein n=1 Tax=Streptomyces niphimycinicus TaxID=2842201 RepID=A0ABS6CBS2_9ACTN|nr:right-handed parallel beta-helix repeat-containing protein [Streptomyces niphimycinicus]MBU3864354.1 right-handed parallel beta-helix repeat-containing protein [Streptomyces niphimycinicus]